jgi:K(+)-stimulated pyrophosphate-energized sodium pump
MSRGSKLGGRLVSIAFIFTLLLGLSGIAGADLSTSDIEIDYYVDGALLVDEPASGDEVAIRVHVENTDETDLQAIVSIYVDDFLLGTDTQTIAPSETGEFSSPLWTALEGHHYVNVTVNSLSISESLDIKTPPEVSPLIYFILIGCIAGLGFAVFLIYWVMRQPVGTPSMNSISNAIKEGAEAFLKRQYKTIGIMAIIIALIFAIADIVFIDSYYGVSGFTLGILTAIAFLFGSACSLIAGYLGMYVSIRANIRTAQASRESMDKAVRTALRGGAVTGFSVVALSLIGVSVLYIAYTFVSGDHRLVPLLIVGFGFGASLVALFAQLGGGIFTKAADVGADLVGKVEAGIPEDDPRNAAVIADLVGDNVGDCAGRGADLFESTAAENIGAMILGIALYPVFGLNGILFPLVARAFGLIATIVGVLVVKMRKDEDPLKPLNRGYYMTCTLAAAFFAVASYLMLGDAWIHYFVAGLIGIIMSIAFVYITLYYTEPGYRPVQEIAKASNTGAGTNLITGISVGLECTAVPFIVISVSLLGAFFLGSMAGDILGISAFQAGLYGTAIATMGMLSTCAYILALDTYGPITDNAGGINEMSGDSSEEAKRITARLDSIGNATKALTKGYAVGSAALAAFLLFSAYMADAHLTSIDMGKPVVFIGGMLGAMLVFIFSAYAIRAVGRAASQIIEEVRRQFREMPGIMTYQQKPDYARCVDITTKAALKEMILPGLIAVIVPVAVGFILRAEALGATLMVGTIVGVILALFMNNAGAAWDNAKKYIEDGKFGGKGSEAHKAGVVGDTVGDPLKDTAGPSLHILVKLLSTITLVLAPLFI